MLDKLLVGLFASLFLDFDYQEDYSARTFNYVVHAPDPPGAKDGHRLPLTAIAAPSLLTELVGFSQPDSASVQKQKSVTDQGGYFSARFISRSHYLTQNAGQECASAIEPNTSILAALEMCREVQSHQSRVSNAPGPRITPGAIGGVPDGVHLQAE